MKRVFTYLAMFRRERRPGDLVFAIGFFAVALAAAAVLPAQAGIRRCGCVSARAGHTAGVLPNETARQ